AVAPVAGSCSRTPKLSLRQGKRSVSNGVIAHSSSHWRAGRRECKAIVLEGHRPIPQLRVKHAHADDLRQLHHSHLRRLDDHSHAMARASLWARLPDERLVGLGYAVPYLERFRADTERTFAFMPAGQGAVNWPPGELSSTALVFDEELPLPDASVDRVL